MFLRADCSRLPYGAPPSGGDIQKPERTEKGAVFEKVRACPVRVYGSSFIFQFRWRPANRRCCWRRHSFIHQEQQRVRDFSSPSGEGRTLSQLQHCAHSSRIASVIAGNLPTPTKNIFTTATRNIVRSFMTSTPSSPRTLPIARTRKSWLASADKLYFFYNLYGSCSFSSGCSTHLNSNELLFHAGLGIRYRMFRHLLCAPRSSPLPHHKQFQIFTPITCFASALQWATRSANNEFCVGAAELCVHEEKRQRHLGAAFQFSWTSAA